MRLPWRLVLAALVLLAGCATLPEPAPGPPSTQHVAGPEGSLSRLIREAGISEGRSGFKPLLYSGQALQTRLALIERAERGIDIQTYVLGDDATGHQLLAALVSAAARGVRVRLLLDDMHTTGMTDLLLAVAAQPGVELRLYNPFASGRDSWLVRAAGLLTDFDRLNRRMHNKLFVVDGRVAVVGGRNMADEYFMRSDEGNFIDFDVVAAGAVAAELGRHFDAFWNSRFALPVHSLADNGLDLEAQRRSFERLQRLAPSPRPLPTVPGPAPAPGLGPLVEAPVQVFFDSPDKTAGHLAPTHRLPIAALLSQAERSVTVVSPYFVPSEAGLERMRATRDRGVEVQVITNSLVDSDVPLVHVAYGRRRMALLRSGIRLFELSSSRLKRQEPIGQALGGSIGRLHAKIGFVDERWLLVGSMNLDPRSANSNTELALVIDSPALTREVLQLLRPAQVGGVYEVRLNERGDALQWVAENGRDHELLDDEPTPPWWQRLRLWLLSLLVPDELL